ncbi:MAG: hypothetical protein MUC56_14390 [Thermoanaerobaculales bacterium]|nr:hypothetical protein [Thermoanaerobaculales bacterium]
MTAGPVVSNMIDAYPNTLAFIAIHDGDSYEVPWGTMRDGVYQAAWTPFDCQDGLYDAWPITSYESKFLARQAIPTDVTIDLEVFGAGTDWNVSAVVCIEPGGTGKTMKVWMAQVLDHYGPANFDRNMVRSGTNGVEITLAPSECTTVTESLTLDSVSQASPDTVKFFAWAQDTVFVYNPQVQYINGTWYGAWFGEIYQGAKALAPFEGAFRDGFEDGTTSAWGSVSP